MMMNQPTGQQQDARYSLDGQWWWDGQAWRLAQPSADEEWQWNGSEWVPNRSPSPSQPAPTGRLANHFSGDALWSILLGSASVLLPLLTSMYFPILPVFGLWRGVLAVRGGRVVGGAIGLTVSILGCLASLIASGLLNSVLH
jgi:hypothetical protein